MGFIFYVFIFVLGKRKKVSDKVAIVEKEGGRRGEDIHLQMVPLNVPSLPPSMTSCKCIEISYQVKVRTKGEGVPRWYH